MIDSLCAHGRADGAGGRRAADQDDQPDLPSPAWCRGWPKGMHFGKKAGLDLEKVVEVISKGAAGSWQMENRHKTMNRRQV